MITGAKSDAIVEDESHEDKHLYNRLFSLQHD